MIIDTHVHFWKLSRGDYGWLQPGNTVLYNDYLPPQLHPQMLLKGVTAAIAVQAAGTIEETEYLLELSATYSWIAGVVGWLDVTSDIFGKQYERLRQNPLLLGIRIGGSTFQEAQGAQRIHLNENLRLMADDGFPIDLLARPNEMPAIVTQLSEVPHLKVVINHLGIPAAQSQEGDPWDRLIGELAEFDNVFCKLSGMITQSLGTNIHLWQPYVKQLLKTFGPQRLLFGSDWPVCLQSGTYSDVLQLFHGVLSGHVSETDLADIAGNNAISVYQIKLR